MSFSYTNDGYVKVWTDGACFDNGRYGARAGIGVWFSDNNKMNVSEPVVGKATNIIAEILAAKRACDRAWEANIRRLQVYTDSEYVINVMNDWIYNWQRNGFRTTENKPVANKQLIIALQKSAKQLTDVRWEYVPGHSGDYGNMRADQLAKAGAERYNQYN